MDVQLPGLDTISETLLPRRYQEEILSKALQANVIAALDTGSGKTFISTLLIKWMATSLSGQGKIIVFLVPKVALVEQQGNFIRKQTPLRIRKIIGAMATDLSDRDGWKQQLADTDVLVMTGMSIVQTIFAGISLLKSPDIFEYDHALHLERG
jgi:endoribonuclease Dicer